jgi:hypothetical protein
MGTRHRGVLPLFSGLVCLRILSEPGLSYRFCASPWRLAE